MKLSALAFALLCAACAPVAAAPEAVRLDDVSAAAYQAGRTQQAAQTADAGSATAYARADAWTVTAAARTEVVAVVAATLQAGADAATARALTPTITPIPTETPAPTQTPRPTWTATPDATVAALRVEQATADRNAAVARGYVGTGVLVVLLLGLAVLVAYGAGRLLASWEYHMGKARRERYLFAGADVMNMVTDSWVERPSQAVTVIEQIPPDKNDERLAAIAADEQWRAMLRVFFQEGDRDGFSMRAMTKPEATKVLSEVDWHRMTEHFSDPAVGILRDAGGNKGMTWGHGWTLARLLEALPRLTPPSGAPAYCLPRTVNSAAPRRAVQHNTTQTA